VTPSFAVQAGYVTSLGRHLEVFPNYNNVVQILPQTLPSGQSITNFVPFPDFARGSSYAVTEGSSYYHGLQTKAEKRFSNGLSFLGTYTWSKVRTDAIDLLNNTLSGYRAPNVPSFGIHGDYSLAGFDIRNVFHLSGNYELPIGRGKRFLNDAGGALNALAGGWSFVWSTTLQNGQPFTLRCPTGTTTGTACNDLIIKGQDPYAGPHNVNQFLNPAAFAQPCKLAPGGAPIANDPVNCVPLSGTAGLGASPGQVIGPNFRRLDFSTFKEFQMKERFRLQFRAEMFNILNHPNFNAPGFGGNGVVAISGATNFTSSNFGKIGSTRDAPYDPRQIQFALKFYY